MDDSDAGGWCYQRSVWTLARQRNRFTKVILTKSWCMYSERFIFTHFCAGLHAKTWSVYSYPMVLVVYGMWLFISGGTMKFNPLIIGGVINWIIACIAVFVEFWNTTDSVGDCCIVRLHYTGISVACEIQQRKIKRLQPDLRFTTA